MSNLAQAIWPYSGHYLPTEENFREFITFLEEHAVDLANVKVMQSHISISLTGINQSDQMFDVLVIFSRDLQRMRIALLVRTPTWAMNQNQLNETHHQTM